ncbi:MAG: AmmeMemoRadiSam system protein B [Myxococcota bacterium]
MTRLLAAALLVSGCATVVRGTYPGDRVMWDDIAAHAEPLTLPTRPVAVVAPHHLIDAHELAGFWAALAAGRPSAVVVLGPDHYARGTGLTVAHAVTYETVYGPLVTDAALAAQLGGGTRDEAFVGEHSIHVHAPFVRRLLPDARFVPVVLQWAAPRAELEALAQRLHATLPADALVVASVDFSHYQPEPWATFHDESAFSTISGFALDELFLREVDSPESLYVAMRFAQLRGAQTATRVLHTNSQRKRVALVLDSTSHQYFTFTPGPVVPRPSVSIAITPDLPQVGVASFERWTWHPSRDSGAPSSPMLARLRGQEDRFFMGPELTVFHLEPGEVLRRELNGFRVVVAREPVGPLEGDCVVRLPLPSARPVVHGVTCTREGVRSRSVPVLLAPDGPRLDVDALGEQRERSVPEEERLSR